MKILHTTWIAVMLIFCCGYGYSQGTTSMGTEFWTAYMANTNPPGTSGGSVMDLYITSNVNTTGTVDLVGENSSTSFTVHANHVTLVSIPASAYIGAQGISNEGIHITSLNPVAIYAHIFAQNSSGATLLLPVTTLGKDYYSINYTQRANETAYSAFLVIATEDSTTVAITPVAKLNDGSAAGVPFTIRLKKGQVYQGLSSLDLTGTTIQSVSSGTNTCKKIAVFSGSTRIQIGCLQGLSSSDNLFQQVYPTVSWGKNFITVPLKSRQVDIFRIMISNSTTNVQLNGQIISPASFVKGLYYEFSSNTVNTITADQPVQVVQYAVTQENGVNCSIDTADIGDPEMIFLTPLEQTLNNVTLFSTSNYLILNSYINVVIPKAGINSFMIDGAPFRAFLPVTTSQSSLSAYYYAQLPVSSGSHTLIDGIGFNAIAYGFGQHESYGYAAGANLENLQKFIALENPVTDSAQTNGCTGQSYNLQLTLPYTTTSIKWSFNDGTAPYTEVNPAVANTSQLGSQTLYTYNYSKNPVSYKSGSYTVLATVTNPDADICGADETIELDFNISDPPVAKFSYAGTKLGDTTAFTDQTSSSNILKSWSWNFGDGQTSSLQNPSHSYLYAGTYNVTLAVSDVDGCSSVYQSTVLIPIAIRLLKGVIDVCQGSASADPYIEQFTVSGISLISNITATAPAGLQVSLNPGTGYGSIITIAENNGKIDSAIIYVRSTPDEPAGVIAQNIVLTSQGQATLNIPVSGVVNALPTINPVQSQTVTNGQTTTAINFTGTANSFGWTGTNSNIGLPATGAGNIASFTAINTTDSPITDIITATPISAGMAYVANSYDNTISVVSAFNGATQTKIGVGQDPDAVTISPDGSKLYVANFTSNTVSVIYTAGDIVASTINVGTGPDEIAVSPDGKWIYVTNESSSTVTIIDATSYAAIKNIAVGTAPTGLTISPDGSRVYVANLGSNNVSIINTATNTVNATIPAGSSPSSVGMSPDGSKIYVANNSTNTVSVISTVTNKIVATINVGLHPNGIAMSSDGSQLYVANYGAATISIINTNTNQVIATVPVGTNPFAISISPDGVSAYVTNEGSNSVSVINTKTLQVTSTIPVGSSPKGIFAVSGTDCTGVPVVFTIKVTPSAHLITAGTLAALTTPYGMASVSTSFQVSGTNITADVLVTPPAGFEVSTDNVHFSKTVTIGATAAVTPTTVYIRIASTTTVGSYTNDIVLSSSGATNVDVSVNGTVIPVGLTITADNKAKVYGNANPLLTVTYNGFVNDDGPAQLIKKPQITTTATKTSPAGTYAITPEDAVSPNYTFTYIPGILTISPTPPQIDIPNTFTPNGDGINDTWDIKYIENYPNCTVNIFNRYGTKLFTSTGYPIPWNGKYNGANLPEGTYYYVIDLKSGTDVMSGWVAIIR